MALVVMSVAQAQTLTIHSGRVHTAVAASTEAFEFSDATTFSVLGATFNIADVDSICADQSVVVDNTVNVVYNGSVADVTVAGNVARYLTVEVTGAHVSIIQSADLANEITYTLQGSTTDGSFWMDGELKASLVLNGLTMACADSAAINIRNGKRISVQLVDGTVNTLSDGASGSQKGCFAVKGHTEFKGGGSLYLTGNASHAFWGGEYVELKKTVGSIVVNKAAGDGFNINQYLEVKGGLLKVSNVGDDGIQVSVTDDTTDELNGQVIISGGELDISVTAAAAKGLKCDDSLTVSDGTVTITTTGTGMYDTEDYDVSGCAAIKAGGVVTIDGGTLTLKSTGAGGKGMNCSSDVYINGGTITATTTGKQYTYNRLSTSPKGIRVAGNLYINGGVITVTCSGGEGSEGLESKSEIYITGGEIIANTYDDAINASSKIDISGGKIYAYASNNDGVDSNGTLYISGGLVIASGTTQPEEGFDCDQNTFSITGGTVIGMGGTTSTPTTSVTTQPVIILTGTSLTQNQYLTLSDASGNAIWAFKVPRTYSSATLLVSSPSISQGSSYTFAKGATVSGGTDWQGYTDDATISGGSTIQTVTVSSMVTGGSSGGGGVGPGGGGGGGGRW